MSQFKTAAYLDFQDVNQSLSYDSFQEDGKQTIELGDFRRGMCVCVSLPETGVLSVSYQGEVLIRLALPEGENRVNLAQDVVAAEGEVTLALSIDGSEVYTRTYNLVGDYMTAYTEYMFRLYRDRREAERLERLRMQCPQPQEGETTASLALAKYTSASAEAHELHRLLHTIRAIDLSHLFPITFTLGDTTDRRKMIDSAIGNISDRLHDAQRLLASITLTVEHARYYNDQN